ncbi:homocysteine S-methyltransferase family protein [Clostridium paraputrificum]|uniref:homocysteine S-methyltransferase family protein n=1 Tax=Clostridium paraputrificum TaxID=29363 RepID=UPI003D33322F
MNNFWDRLNNYKGILMEGALAERLKREYNIPIDEDVALASIIYNKEYSKALKDIFMEYIDIANRYNLPIMITTPTRRANKERISKSKYNKEIIKDNVLFLKEIRKTFNNDVFIGGLMGCYGDAYSANDGLGIEESIEFHSWQAKLFKEAEVDFLFAGIMPTLNEAIGMAKAMESTGLQYIISFMIRKDGKLIDGTTINDAIRIIDESVDRIPLCYMTNCVHPDIVYEALYKDFNQTDTVKNRFIGIQANAACLSPEELDNSHDLVSSDPISLANSIMKLRNDFNFKILGGCCGTDDKYIEEIAKILI